MLRYNSTNNEFEGYINGNWGSIGGGAAGGLIFRGTFDASTGAIASGGSLYTCPAGGSGGTVDTAIGDLYIVTTAGSFFCSGTSLNVGDEVICITAATATNDNVNNWNAIASGAGGAVTGSGTTNYVPKFTGATVVGNSSIFNDASGNVGIGTTSPDRTLSIKGNSATNIPLTVESGTGQLNCLIAMRDSNTTTPYKVAIGSATDDMIFRAGGAERMRIDSAGDIGIGTTSPSKKLHVSSGDQSTSRIRLSNTNTGGNDIDLVAGINNVGQDGFSIYNATSNQTQLVVQSGGNVGIGTSSPSTKLDVSGEDSVIASFRVTGGVSNNKRLEIGSGGDRTILKSFTDTTDAAAGIAFSNGNSEAMRIDSTGNVGIGTDSPEVSLDLGSNTDAIRVPNGPIADRPSGILPGMIRYNTSTSEFEGYSGTLNVSGSWGALGGGSLPTKTVDTFTGSGQVFIDLTVEASSVNYIDMYIDGVYQAKATYTIATPGGTGISRLTLVSGTFPTGVSIETVTTT